ncbi:ATP F0F1 synthase subunit B [Oceanicella sp. SM1341]|uniref:F0F1 ATP synthase subunit B family protein n=1 Tax=Oceanicella sp. SM1341 TaxID=1548889 RepID=UPI000E4EEBF2|nr:ATP F0F1 synthase subunit B [Oceanicella sp. SM1341]
MDLILDTNLLVAVSFFIFVGILLWVKVPAKVAGILDGRAAHIRAEIEEARQLREEAQTLLASYERKQKEVERLAEDIVTSAREEARAAAAEGREELERSVARRLRAAEDQIATAEAEALRQVRDRAISVAVAAAAEVMKTRMPADQANALVDASIAETARKLH